MDQIKIGKFIAQRRKECNLTQLQLAESLGITDRAVSKWENREVPAGFFHHAGSVRNLKNNS